MNANTKISRLRLQRRHDLRKQSMLDDRLTLLNYFVVKHLKQHVGGRMQARTKRNGRRLTRIGGTDWPLVWACVLLGRQQQWTDAEPQCGSRWQHNGLISQQGCRMKTGFGEIKTARK